MKLANPFSNEVRLLFLYVYYCWECGRSDRGLELHHIFGRISGSAFNAASLCKFCHDHILHDPETHRRLFLKTFHFLAEQGYISEKTDITFFDNPTVDNELRTVLPW